MPSPSTSAKVIIQLHYNDLRTHDSPVLGHVHSKEQSAVTHFLPIYVFDERIMALSAVPGYEQQQQQGAVDRPVTIRGLGDLPRSKSSQTVTPEPRTRLGKFWKTGRHRTKFTVESVFDLKSRYRDKGNDLLVACGCMESVVSKIVESLQKGDAEETYEVTEVWMQKEVSLVSSPRFSTPELQFTPDHEPRLAGQHGRGPLSASSSILVGAHGHELEIGRFETDGGTRRFTF